MRPDMPIARPDTIVQAIWALSRAKPPRITHPAGSGAKGILADGSTLHAWEAHRDTLLAHLYRAFALSETLHGYTVPLSNLPKPVVICLSELSLRCDGRAGSE